VTTEPPPPQRAAPIDDAWLDAAFAATREARVRRAPTRADDPRARARLLVLSGADVAQLRWMLRLRRPVEAACDDGAEWVIELRNTRARVATLRLSASRFVRADGVDAWAELKDGETLARWLSCRGFRPPFDAWRSDRGSVLSPR
jgi:hypothetical protein